MITILPPGHISFTQQAPFPYPMFNSSQSAWGRLNMFYWCGTLGTWPTVIGPSYNNADIYCWQYFEDHVRSFRLLSPYNGSNFAGNMGVPVSSYGFAAQPKIYLTDEHNVKGLLWWNFQARTNFNKFPYPDYADGEIYSFTAFHQGNANICFAEGGISCVTSNGGVFPGNVQLGGEAFLTNPGAGCPAANNYGLGIVNPWILDPDNNPTFTVADGTGPGPQPGLRQYSRVQDFFGYKNNRCVLVAPYIVAQLDDSGVIDVANSYVLRIWTYIVYQSPSKSCGGSIELKMFPWYEIDLRELLGASATGASTCAMWTNGNGLLTVCFTNINFVRRIFVIQFPGPKIKWYTYDMPGASPNWWAPAVAMIYPSGRVGLMYADNGDLSRFYAVSESVIDIDREVSYTPSAVPSSIYAGNIIETIGG